MALRSIRSGATAMTEAVFLQLVTDLVAASGILDVTGTQFQVTGSGTNLSVNTAVGRAYLAASGGNTYPIIGDTAAVNTAINTNSSGNPRITSIVLTKNLGTTPNSDDTNTVSIMAVDGAPASSPSAPSGTTIQSAVGAGNPYTILSNVRVNSGVSVINTSDCTDVRTAVVFASKGAKSGASVSASIAQNIPNNTWTKLAFDTKTFDFNTEYDASTNYRFTAKQYGVYSCMLSLSFTSGTASPQIAIYKNGVAVARSLYQSNPSANYTFQTNVIVELAATDYVEFYILQQAGSTIAISNATDISKAQIMKVY